MGILSMRCLYHILKEKMLNSLCESGVHRDGPGNLSHLWTEVVTCPCEDGGARLPSEAGPVKTLQLLPVS